MILIVLDCIKFKLFVMLRCHMRSSFSISLLYHAYVYLEFLILACTIYILAPLYPKVNGQYAPYVADDNLSVSAVYQIPKEEFESVIMKYFNIDSETLQSKTIYDSENLTYEYKPRGFEEVEYPEYPYSEVVGFTENNDGTITLTANVVFPYAGDSKVYAHEVVVRPLENGRVQYVSNRIIPSEDNYRETWHTPRLTLEEWEELYGGE